MTQREINNAALKFSRARSNEMGASIHYEKVDDKHIVAYNIDRKEGFIAGAEFVLGEKKTFKPEELEQFVHDHIQQKIDHNELHLTGIKMDGKDPETFKRELELYENALLEGIINGIIMCGCEVEGIETD